MTTSPNRMGCVWLCCAVLCTADLSANQPQRQRITPQNAVDLAVLREIDADLTELRWRPDGSELAFVRWEQPVEILNPETLEVRGTICEDRRVIHFAFGRDLDVLAFCENGTTVHLVSAATIDTVELDAVNHQPQMAFSPDGTLLAAGGYGTLARVWSVADGRLVHELNVGVNEGGLWPVFSPDGRTLAVGNRNFTTCLFDVESGKRLRELPHRMSHGLKFSPDGKTLAVVYVDGSITLWNVADGQPLHSAKTSAEELYRVDWSPAGNLLVTSGLKGPITLWRSADLSVVRELEAPEWVIEASFSPDGTRILTAGGGILRGADRRVQVWGIPQ